MPPPHTYIHIYKPFSLPSSLLRFYAIIVIRITDSFNRESPPDPSNYTNAKPYDRTADPRQEFYITAAWNGSQEVPETYTIGDRSVTVANGIMYENVGLSSDTNYAYLIHIEIKSDTDEVRI